MAKNFLRGLLIATIAGGIGVANATDVTTSCPNVANDAAQWAAHYMTLSNGTSSQMAVSYVQAACAEYCGYVAILHAGYSSSNPDVAAYYNAAKQNAITAQQYCTTNQCTHDIATVINNDCNPR